MAGKLLLAALGVLELLFPRRVVDFWMRLATDDEGDLREWVYTAARIEGVLVLLWLGKRAVRSCRRDDGTAE